MVAMGWILCNLTLSQGTIYNMLNRVADYLLPVYNGIKKDVKNAKVVGSDESGIKVNNDNFWTWTSFGGIFPTTACSTLHASQQHLHLNMCQHQSALFRKAILR